MLRHPLHQVAGHHGLVGSLGADVVGGDGPVAQAHHQGGRARRQAQQRPQLRRQGPRRPAEGVLLPAGQAVQLQGHIGAHRLSHGPRPGCARWSPDSPPASTPPTPRPAASRPPRRSPARAGRPPEPGRFSVSTYTSLHTPRCGVDDTRCPYFLRRAPPYAKKVKKVQKKSCIFKEWLLK